jgi:hypothetical protein
MTAEQAAYRGAAMTQLAILRQQMKLGGLVIGNRIVELAGGVWVEASICYNHESVKVYLPEVITENKIMYPRRTIVISGVALHPRSGDVHNIPYTEYVYDSIAGTQPVTRSIYGVRGGWENGVTPLDTDYIYPLVDEDNATFVVTSESAEDQYIEGSFVGTNGNYGNLYWDNGAVYDTETKTWDKPYVVLSWRGTPTRHFSLPNNIDIPGFSMFETSTPGLIEDTPVYTAFGTKLYKGGEVLADAPRWSWPYNGSGVGNKCLILGAMQGDDGLFIVTQNDHYNAPKNVWIYSDGERREGDTETYLATVSDILPPVTIVFTRELTKPGFFLGLWKSGGKVDGWTLVSEMPYRRTGLPWFGNMSGTEFVCSNGDKLSTDGTYVAISDTAGTYSETGPYSVLEVGVNEIPAGTKIYNVDQLAFTASYAGTAIHEYLLNQIQKAIVITTVNSYTNNVFPKAVQIIQNDDADIVISSSDNIFGHITIGAHNEAQDGYAVGTQFSVDLYWTLNCPDIDIEWNIPGTTVTKVNASGSVVAVTSSSGICGGVVEISVTSGPFSGIEHDIFPNGKWVVENSGTLTANPTPDCPFYGWSPSALISCGGGSAFAYGGIWNSAWSCADQPALNIGDPVIYSADTTTGACYPAGHFGWGSNNFPTYWIKFSWVCTSDPRPAADPNHI